MVCQISWTQIQWQKNQICFCYKWSRKIRVLCWESLLQCSRKRTSSGFYFGLNGAVLASQPPARRGSVFSLDPWFFLSMLVTRVQVAQNGMQSQQLYLEPSFHLGQCLRTQPQTGSGHPALGDLCPLQPGSLNLNWIPSPGLCYLPGRSCGERALVPSVLVSTAMPHARKTGRKS